MSKFDSGNLNKKFKDRMTGETARFIARCEGPSITLEKDNGERIHFGLGGMMSLDWEIYEEESFSEKIKKLVAILNDLQLIAERAMWQSDAGIKQAQKIIDEFHAGCFGSREGVFVQTQNAINQIEKLCSNGT